MNPTRRPRPIGGAAGLQIPLDDTSMRPPDRTPMDTDLQANDLR
ncbi:hypothetical protein [Variovorax sp. LT1R16]